MMVGAVVLISETIYWTYLRAGVAATGIVCILFSLIFFFLAILTTEDPQTKGNT
jgi:ABC-type uncharacterized transport system permease subunit